MCHSADSVADRGSGAERPVRQLLLETLCSAQLEADCGIGTAELAALTPGDFDLLRGTVKVRGPAGTELRPLPERLGRELEEFLLFFRSPKEPVFARLDEHYRLLIEKTLQFVE